MLGQLWGLHPRLQRAVLLVCTVALQVLLPSTSSLTTRAIACVEEPNSHPEDSESALGFNEQKDKRIIVFRLLVVDWFMLIRREIGLNGSKAARGPDCMGQNYRNKASNAITSQDRMFYWGLSKVGRK